MRILSINHSDFNGGAAKAAYRLHMGLRNFNVESNILVKWRYMAESTAFEASRFATSGMKKPVEEYVLNIKRKLQKRKWDKYPGRENAFMSDLLGIPLLKAINSFKFDILHIHWISHEFLDIHELTKLNKPIVWTLHDCWAFTGGCHYFYECKKYEKQCGSCPMLKSSDDNDLTREIWKKKKEVYANCNLHIVTPSKWLGDRAKASSLLHDFPVSVIPNGLDTNIYNALPKEAAKQILRLNPDKKYILFGAANATSDKRKGFHFLDEGLKILKTQTKDDVELLIFGSGTVKEGYLDGFPSHYLGTLHDDISLVAAYSAAEVVIVPSLSENLSNVIMESMSCGTPVVAFDIGGNSDMIDHKENGYLAKAFDFTDLSDGIKWCIDNNKDRHLSEKTRQKVLDNYTIEMIVERYRKLFESIIKK